MSKQVKIEFQETPRDYFSQIPNIIHELVKAKEISHAARTLYGVYRRIAGNGGSCWMGMRALAEECGYSLSTVCRSKKELIKSFSMLNGKSLIINTPGKKKDESPDTVAIVDIWQENHDFFKNLLRVSYRNMGVSPVEQKKNEFKKKKIYKNDSEIVHKSHCGNVHSHSFPSAPAAGSFPLSPISPPGETSPMKKIDLTDEDTIAVIELESEYSAYFKPQSVTTWLKKFGGTKTHETIKLFLKTLKTQKEPIRNPEAWMEKALKDNFSENDKLVFENKTFAQNLKKAHNLRNLKLNKRYCQETSTGKDAYYHLPEHEFKRILNSWI